MLFTFEAESSHQCLCDPDHRAFRMIANLRNVDEDLARRVAGAMNLDVPAASPVAAPVVDLNR